VNKAIIDVGDQRGLGATLRAEEHVTLVLPTPRNKRLGQQFQFELLRTLATPL
jgi:hypothetical protein